MAYPPVRSRRHAFTLIELCVVTAICSVLIALILPAVQNARESARRIVCSSQLRQLGLALHQYEGTHRVFPPGMQVIPFKGVRSYSKAFGWTIPLLPHLEQTALYGEFNFNLDCQIHQRHLTVRRIQILECPSDPHAQIPIDWRRPGTDPFWGDYDLGGWGATSFLGVSGTDGFVTTQHPTDCDRYQADDEHRGLHAGMFYGNSSIGFRDVMDGTSSTLLLGERGVTSGMGKWGGPGFAHKCPAGLGDVLLPGVIEGTYEGRGGVVLPKAVASDAEIWWSWHPGGTHFLLVDGSVHFASYSIDRGVQFARSTRAGTEIVEENW